MLLCLFAYPHVKRVVSGSCERVISCRVRAFTLFPEIPWRVTNAAENSGYIPACNAVVMLKIEARPVCTRMRGCSSAPATNKSK